MDRSATPWRVLDDTATAEGRAAGAGDSAGASATVLPGISWKLLGGLGLAAALGIAAFVVAASGPGGEINIEGGAAWTASGAPERSGRAPSASAALVVDVQGAVLRPGVLQLVPGSRVADAIAAAGGFGPRVDAERAGRELNLASELQDGDRVVVPSRDDPVAAAGAQTSGTAGPQGGASGGLIDLNGATAAELDQLPGVGPVTAQKIIDARAEKPFASVDELRERKIVGPSTFEKLRDLVTVR
jgi:competence protein ComEA